MDGLGDKPAREVCHRSAVASEVRLLAARPCKGNQESEGALSSKAKHPSSHDAVGKPDYVALGVLEVGERH